MLHVYKARQKATLARHEKRLKAKKMILREAKKDIKRAVKEGASGFITTYDMGEVDPICFSKTLQKLRRKGYEVDLIHVDGVNKRTLVVSWDRVLMKASNQAREQLEKELKQKEGRDDYAEESV